MRNNILRSTNDKYRDISHKIKKIYLWCISMRIHRFSRILALLRYPCNSIHETNEFHPRNVSLGRLYLYQIYLRKDYWQIFWSTYLDDSVVCTPQFKAMLVRIRPAGLKQQRAFRVWQIAIRTWEKYNIPHAVRWWSSKVLASSESTQG